MMIKKFEARKSPIHGKGVFALTSFKKGEFIGKYTGKKTKTDSTHVLWVWIDEENYYGIQGTSPLKYLNHSAKPNAHFDGENLYALKSIKANEEITFHYGEEWNEVP